MLGKEAPQRGDAGGHVPVGQHLPQLGQRRVMLLLDRLQDESRMILDLRRSAITTSDLRRFQGEVRVFDRSTHKADGQFNRHSCSMEIGAMMRKEC